jgi:hypothetical protein
VESEDDKAGWPLKVSGAVTGFRPEFSPDDAGACPLLMFKQKEKSDRKMLN